MMGGGWIDMPLQRKRSIRRGGSGGEGRFISYILGNYIEHIGFFTLRCFKSSVKVFSQVICHCMCKQVEFQHPPPLPMLDAPASAEPLMLYPSYYTAAGVGAPGRIMYYTYYILFCIKYVLCIVLHPVHFIVRIALLECIMVNC